MFHAQFLEGKRALVTGSTSGIGLAIARALAGAGAQVVLNGFGDAGEIAGFCKELDATHSGADLTDAAQIEAMMAEAGEIDVLVNNAGMQHVAPVEDFPVEKWDTIIALNQNQVTRTFVFDVNPLWGEGLFYFSALDLTTPTLDLVTWYVDSAKVGGGAEEQGTDGQWEEQTVYLPEGAKTITWVWQYNPLGLADQFLPPPPTDLNGFFIDDMYFISDPSPSSKP